MDNPSVMHPQSQNRRAQKPRTPLQERSQSQTNEESSRLGRESRREPIHADIFSATPFPTKPQHVLLPSAVRKQRSFRDGENQLPGILEYDSHNVVARPPGSSGHELLSDESKVRKEPVVQLKRSVTTLRDMYEAQAERSRPSTATSYLPRPGTANSRLRSASSSEGLSGRNAWEELNKVSADDMALLPTLSRSSIDRMAYEPSFASRMGHQPYLTSSPNYHTYSTSSPRGNVFHDEPASGSEGYRQSSSSGIPQTSSSSPNFVRLGRSSSISETLNTEQSASSPNFMKLGTSSPGLRSSSSPTPSDASRKRKRADAAVESSFAAKNRALTSSPPYAVIAASSSEASLRSPGFIMPSSPPRPYSSQSQSMNASSPVLRLLGPDRSVSGSSSSSSAHAHLQAVLSSSPMPPIQYPVIRAPAAVASNLNVPKRITRHSSTESSGHWISRLSPVPSEWDEGLSRNASKRSRHAGDDNEALRSDSPTPEPTGNESQIRIIPMSEDDHEHEAVDELRALPKKRAALAYRSPPTVPVRTNSLFGTGSSSSDSQSQSRLNSLRTSLDTRLNSMRSYTHSRQNSFMSGSIRPGSSSSHTASIVVPTWARRYYSGLYRDSFQYLYPSQTNSAAQMPISLHNHFDRTTSMASGALHPGTSIAPSHQRRRSWASIRDSLRSSMLEFVPSVLIPKNQSRLEARKSHMSPGIGPLVSNPVNPDLTPTRIDPYRESYGIRRVSDQLPAADPRAHWAGITDEQQIMMQYQDSTPYHSSREVNRQSADSQSVYFDAASGQIMTKSRFVDVPHLHHDRRLNTGSSKSRGFGFPFNQKGRHQAPSVYDASTRPSWVKMDLRDAQVTCFVIGFVLPISWFVGAFLPLPQRPETFGDIEKAMYEQHHDQHAGGWEGLDVVAKLRLERHIKGIEELKWQNARWWKRMNRWMCFVGVVVFVLVIVLAIIGTRNHW